MPAPQVATSGRFSTTHRCCSPLSPDARGRRIRQIRLGARIRPPGLIRELRPGRRGDRCRPVRRGRRRQHPAPRRGSHHGARGFRRRRARTRAGSTRHPDPAVWIVSAPARCRRCHDRSGLVGWTRSTDRWTWRGWCGGAWGGFPLRGLWIPSVTCGSCGHGPHGRELGRCFRNPGPHEEGEILDSVPAEPAIIVSTPGSEPVADGGTGPRCSWTPGRCWAGRTCVRCRTHFACGSEPCLVGPPSRAAGSSVRGFRISSHWL